MKEPTPPNDCSECQYFGKNGKHLLSGKAHFPSLCEKDLYWSICGGKQGIKKEPPETEIMTDLIKIHIYLCHLIQHHLTPVLEIELLEYIKSWLLMMEE